MSATIGGAVLSYDEATRAAAEEKDSKLFLEQLTDPTLSSARLLGVAHLIPGGMEYKFNRYEYDDSSDFVPHFQTLGSRRFQPRQFEFHPEWSILAAGTTEETVALFNWQSGQMLCEETFQEPHRDENGDMDDVLILAIKWLNRTPSRFIAASSIGFANMYSVDPSCADLTVDSSHFPGSSGKGRKTKTIRSKKRGKKRWSLRSSSRGLLKLKHAYASLHRSLTSIHVNCEDELLTACGYTNSVYMYDLHTGVPVHAFRNIHDGPINIARFANHSPSLMITGSFDKKIKMWDVRGPYVRPVRTVDTEEKVLLVTFSPNDMYFLSSSLDNQVHQYSVTDGRHMFKLDIEPSGSDFNFTRSYYMNGGDLTVTGSSNQNKVFVCSATTGQRVTTVSLVGLRTPNLMVQSLRGNPVVDNRLAVLVCHSRDSAGFELVDVDLNRDCDGAPVEHVFALSSVASLSDCRGGFLGDTKYSDLQFVCKGGKSVLGHSSLLCPRWPWLARILFPEAKSTAEPAETKSTAEPAETKSTQPAETFTRATQQPVAATGTGAHHTSSRSVSSTATTNTNFSVFNSSANSIASRSSAASADSEVPSEPLPMESFLSADIPDTECDVPSTSPARPNGVPHKATSSSSATASKPKERARRSLFADAPKSTTLARVDEEETDSVVNSLSIDLADLDVSIASPPSSSSGAAGPSTTTAVSSSSHSSEEVKAGDMGDIDLKGALSELIDSSTVLELPDSHDLVHFSCGLEGFYSLEFDVSRSWKANIARLPRVRTGVPPGPAMQPPTAPAAPTTTTAPTTATASTTAATADSTTDNVPPPRSSSPTSSQRPVSLSVDSLSVGSDTTSCALYPDISPEDRKKRVIHVDLTISDFAVVMTYLYTGRIIEIDLPQAMRIMPWTAPEKFDLPRLRELMQRFVGFEVNVNNCLEVYQFALKNRLGPLSAYCEDYIARSLHWFSMGPDPGGMIRAIGDVAAENIYRRLRQGLYKDEKHMRLSHGVVRVGRRVFVLGGYGRLGAHCLGLITIFDLPTCSWCYVPAHNAPTLVCLFTVTHISTNEFESALVVIGGKSEYEESDETWILNLVNMKWSTANIRSEKKPGPRIRHAACKVGNSIWVFGGCSKDEFLSDTWVLDLNTWRWRQSHSLPTGRFGHTATYVESQNWIIILGAALDYRAFVWETRS